MNMTEVLLFTMIMVMFIGFIILPAYTSYKQKVGEYKKKSYWDQTQYKE